MIQDTSATTQAALIHAVKPTRQCSATRLIGRTLRALYDEYAQPCPDRLTELVAALDADAVAN